MLWTTADCGRCSLLGWGRGTSAFKMLGLPSGMPFAVAPLMPLGPFCIRLSAGGMGVGIGLMAVDMLCVP